MPTVRCDRCDAVCPEAEVRDGWCENCGKRLPEYLLYPAKADPAPGGATAEVDDPGEREVAFRPTLAARLTACFFLSFGAGAALLASAWTATHMPGNPQKTTEAVVVAVFLGVMGSALALIIPARLLGGRLAIGPTEVRFTRGALGGAGPHLVTDRAPFAAVERYGIGLMPEYTGVGYVPGRVLTVMLRVAPCPEVPRGGDVRIALKEYPDAARILTLLDRRLRRRPEPIALGWLMLGRFR